MPNLAGCNLPAISKKTHLYSVELCSPEQSSSQFLSFLFYCWSVICKIYKMYNKMYNNLYLS